MSRVGKKPIAIPEKTDVTFDGYTLTVKGPLGSISRIVKPDVKIDIKDGTVLVSTVRSEAFPLWGTYAAHVKNMLKGVHTLYQKKLIVEGIGFKSDVKGSDLNLALGFSHPVSVPIPAGLKVTADKNIISISGIDKELVGAFASEIRSLKKPEPYKGKGIRYEAEVIRRKQGKKAA
jgi:large subunit ribosomal protein L6